MVDFSFHLLDIFDALYRHRNLGRAAEELGLSQPSVSYSLKQLRALISDPLFVKIRSGVEPTTRAHELYPVVQAVLSDVHHRILAAPTFDPGTARRTFVLAMSDIGEMYFLPPLLAYFSRVAPSVDVQTVSMSPLALMSALQRSEVDLAAGYFPDLKGNDVFQQHLYRHGYVCLVRKNHPALSEKFTKAQFCSLPHALIETEVRSQEFVERTLNALGVERRRLLRTRHLLGIPSVIASTDMIVTVPAVVGTLFAKLGDIEIVDPPFHIPKIEVKHYWHRCQLNDSGNRWLRRVFVELFSDQDGTE